MELDEKIKCLAQCVKEFHWKENDERTEACLIVDVNPYYGRDKPFSPQCHSALMSCTKDDIVQFIESLCESRTDTYSIDAIRIDMDGDTIDTTMKVSCDIHLAK